MQPSKSREPEIEDAARKDAAEVLAPVQSSVNSANVWPSLSTVFSYGCTMYRSSVMKYKNDERFSRIFFPFFSVVFVKYIHRTRNMAFIMRAFV